jgi:hypothetical protein
MDLGYDTREPVLQTGGNVYYNGARPYIDEASALTLTENPKLKLVNEADQFLLFINFGHRSETSA